MAAKGQKLQIVDIGTHFVKAIKCDYSQGQVAVTDAASYSISGNSSEIDAILQEVTAGMGALTTFFDKKQPVHFVVNEMVCQVGIDYINNVPDNDVQQALNTSQNKFLSTYGVSSYEEASSGVSRVFTLRKKSQGDKSQIVAASAYAKAFYLEQVANACRGAKLTFGGIYPRLFTYEDLFYMAYGARGGVEQKVAVLVDVGFTSTEIVAFKDGKIVFQKVLHMGGKDFYKELNIEPQALVPLVAAVGFTDNAGAVRDCGVDAGDPARVVETLQGQADQLFTKIQLAVDYFSTVAATDFNTSMNTVMAVRKGPEILAFAGTLSTVPGFLDLARNYFGDAAAIIDPSEFCTFSSSKSDLPPNSFALCVAAAALIGGGKGGEYNMGAAVDRFKSSGSSSTSAGGSSGGGGGSGGPEPFVPNWVLILGMIAFLGMGYWWFENDKLLKKLTRELGGKRTELAQASDAVTQYRDLREKEQLARLQVEYVGVVVGQRISVQEFMTEIAGMMPEGVKLFQVSITATMPEPLAADAVVAADAPPPHKTIQFTLCGAGLERTNVNGFLRSLQEYQRFEIGESVVQIAGKGGGSGACQPPSSLPQQDKQYSFQVKGKLKLPAAKPVQGG